MDAKTTDVDRARDLIAAEAPRRLRLDELLRELGARDTASARDPAIERAGEVDPRATKTTNRSDVLTPTVGAARARTAAAPDLPATARAEAAPPVERPASLTVGELVDKAAEGGFGFLVGILTLIAIPFFGLSTPFGLAIALIGAQMMLGRATPWLPRRARRRPLKMTMLDRVLGLLARRTRWLARSTRRRFEFLIRPRLIGLAIVILALGLALPLPIPGSNLIFLIPLFVYSVGVLERDGVWIAIGHLLLAIDLALLFVFSATVVMVLEKIWGWFF